jgi:hypothetical protein
VVLFREIRQRGYRGGQTRVKDFVRSLRPPPQPDPGVRFETGPGQQMQADWASIRGGKNRLSVFVATLGWRGAAYTEFCEDERVETLIRCHEDLSFDESGAPGPEAIQRVHQPRRRHLRYDPDTINEALKKVGRNIDA